MYANDTVLDSTDEGKAIAHAYVKHDLNVFYGWCQANKLTDNIKKTKMMLFETRAIIKKSKLF